MTMSGPSAKTAFKASTVSLDDVACDWSRACLAPSCMATGKLSGLMSVIATLLAEKAFAAANTISPVAGYHMWKKQDSANTGVGYGTTQCNRLYAEQSTINTYHKLRYFCMGLVVDLTQDCNDTGSIDHLVQASLPMGPAPRIATFFPGPTPPLLHACTATHRQISKTDPESPSYSTDSQNNYSVFTVYCTCQHVSSNSLTQTR